MDGETKMRTCRCGAEFEARDFLMDGRVIFTSKLCQTCVDDCAKEAEREHAETKRRDKEESWKEKCPPLYRTTNLDDPRLSPVAVAAIGSWEDQGDGVGLAIRGVSGRGKTRLAFVLAKRLYMAGNSVEAITATRLAHLCVESYDDSDRIKNSAREKLRAIRACRYLVLDDLGKQKFTDRAETELYDLIETRTSNLLPTIWTANVSSDEFAQMMSEDRGAPIIRRLSEFSTVINL